ncbi:MAG TPA: hypothetical protein VFS05_00520, partial [Gemmatimonadaceae bacterium]|nr:hypothetical protein [Gemmatimonadaceae bacterium]
MRFTPATSLTVALLVGGIGADVAPAQHSAPSPGAGAADSLVVSTEWLAAHLSDPSVVVLHVVHDGDYDDGH